MRIKKRLLKKWALYASLKSSRSQKSSNGERFTQVQFLGQRSTDKGTFFHNRRDDRFHKDGYRLYGYALESSFFREQVGARNVTRDKICTTAS